MRCEQLIQDADRMSVYLERVLTRAAPLEGVRSLQGQTVEADVEVRLAPELDAVLLRGRHIGPRGLFLACTILLEPGEVVSLAFSLPGVERRIEARGRVVRTVEELDDAGMVLEFDVLSRDAWRALWLTTT